MSKKDFSKKIIESMENKINAIKNINPDEFAKKDKYAELALCLTYMTLSKEKIIDKDEKNNHPLKRLKENVDRSEIDKVFDNNFSKEMPVIINAAVNDKLWILDNIRDSIMHGQFDIDEEKECFILNNKQSNRTLQAEIPFSWFIAYTKNNILSQKKVEEINVKGFYYNIDKKDNKNIRVYKELTNSIFYNVKIEGDKINYSEAEKTVKELFDKYSKEEIDESIIEQYRQRIDAEPYAYDEKYLVSYYIASDKIKKDLQTKYPNNRIDIEILKQKQKNKIIEEKNLPKEYYSYNLLMNILNEIESEKGMNNLKATSNLYENYNTPKLSFALSKLIGASISSLDLDAMMNRNNPKNLLAQAVSNAIKTLDTNMKKETLGTSLRMVMELFEDLGKKEYRLSQMVDNNKATNSYEKYMLFSKNRELLIQTCVSALGLASLTINHEDLYEKHFENEFSSDYVDSSYSVKKYTDIIGELIELEKDKLEEQAGIKIKENNIESIKDANGAYRDIQKASQWKTEINEANVRITKYEIDIQKLETELFRLTPKNNELSPKQLKIKRKLERRIRRLEKNYLKLASINNKQARNNKNKVMKLINAALNEYKEETSEFMYVKCQKMDDTIEIMRNSLSHVGRVKLIGSKIVFNDYDKNGKKSGQVICDYEAFKNILNEPYQKQKTL
jgi:hypothetical protein